MSMTHAERALERLNRDEPNPFAVGATSDAAAKLALNLARGFDIAVCDDCVDDPSRVIDALRRIGMTDTAALVERLVAVESAPA